MPSDAQWVTRGFEAFRAGTFGNAGQNLYVSRTGVLQRIHQFDLGTPTHSDPDGYCDLLFCNSQDHWERPPVYVYRDVMGTHSRRELPSDGSVSGAVADLNGDGYDDLVLAMDYNGTRFDLNAFIYYGGPDGLGEHRVAFVPAPAATCVTAGDFNGDGRPDLAFLCGGRLRVFYQSELGFEPQRFVDLDITAEQIEAADLDGDGFADLYALTSDGQARVYWGGAEGLEAVRYTDVPDSVIAPAEPHASMVAGYPSGPGPTPPRPKAVWLDGTPHLFIAQSEQVLLVPVGADRTLGEPMAIPCSSATSVAVGDVDGDGHPDLVIAARSEHEGQECSWVYWGSAAGFVADRRTPVPTQRARDVAVGDLDGDGRAEVVICQDRTEESYSFCSLVYRLTPAGAAGDPVRLESHDAQRVFIARTCDEPLPQVILVNHRARGATGDVSPVIYYGGADGFAPERSVKLRGRDAVDAVCCDLNDDGRPDVVLANCSENAVHLDPGSFVFLQGPDGFACEPTQALPTTRAHGVCCADLNHDGYLDLIFVGFNSPDLLIFFGGPDGFVAEPQRIRMEVDGVVYDDPRWLYLADLNNDGWLDLFVPQISADRSFILWGGPEGFSMERRQMLAVVHASCAQAADLTGNGWLDLLVGGHAPALQGPHDSFVYIYWNGPEGLREDRRTLLPAMGVNAMCVADFNNDGNLDVFVCNYHNGRARDQDSFLYWGRAGARFSAEDCTRFFTHSASGCVAADFDEDGWTDLAIAYHKVWNDHVGHSAVWWNGPSGFHEGRITRLPTLGPHGMPRTGTANQADRGPEEYYTSPPFELPAGTRVKQITWEAEVPAKTWVRAQLRFARTREGLGDAPWQGPRPAQAWFEQGDTAEGTAQDGRWIQYRLALGAPDGRRTPRVTAVRVTYGG